MTLPPNARPSIAGRKIGIAMSGGVDSTATALLLKEHSEIYGFFMRLNQPDFDEQLDKVTTIGKKLNIPVHVIDLREQFTDEVLNYFRDSYFNGLTPNPCMVCNREIKFGLFLEAILSEGMEYMATGHYARIIEDDQGFHLLDGLDPTKDQSYFLARLSSHQLAHTIFPLGEWLKKDTYTLVEQHGFTEFRNSESQDVCFMADTSVGNYLAGNYPEAIQPGVIVDTSGKELGTHDGLFRYTIGQRRGLGLPDATPWYVAGMDSETNRLIVCKNEELFTNTIRVKELHWLNPQSINTSKPYKVRIRYSHRGSMAVIHLSGSGTEAEIVFDEKQRAVTPGQFAVWYEESEVIGSGIIL